jgi:hypothetical protein
MGDSVYADGAYTITPPLPWSRFKDSPYYVPDVQNIGSRRSTPHLRLIVEEVTFEDGDDLVTRRLAVGAEPTWKDTEWAAFAVQDLQDLIDSFPASEFTGFIELTSPDYLREGIGSAVSRIYALRRTAVESRPTLLWPEVG